MKPIVWAIAGLDSSGGAGIQTDITVMKNLGAHACSIVTALTSQNLTSMISKEYVSAEMIQTQINLLTTELPPKVIKLGMLGNQQSNKIILDFIKKYEGHVIVDPLLLSSSGKQLYESENHLNSFLPYITLLTPNVLEAQRIINQPITTYNDIEKAANTIINMGVKNVLIKGGHFNDSQFSQDFWTNGTDKFWLSSPRYTAKNYRGTGCTLASAIAACLALDYTLKDALVIAKMYVNHGIRLATQFNSDISLLHHNTWPEEQIDLPFLSHAPVTKIIPHSPTCAIEPLGLYPVVDSVDWLKKLLPLGVSTIQLRIKNKINIEEEIKSAIILANDYQARLFINDYWQLAIKHKAYGIHLGQEDLATADIAAIKQAGLRLGISTHCYYEVAHAHTYAPSYIACGPIFPTTSKIMPFQPQGLGALKYWQRTLQYPLVAIGGINTTNFTDVVNTGVSGIAMISAITHASDFTLATKEFLHQMKVLHLPNHPLLNSEPDLIS